MHRTLVVLTGAVWAVALPFAQAQTGWKQTIIAGSPATLSPYSVAVDPSDRVHFWDQRCYIRRVTPTGVVNVAGNGSCGYAGDGGPATSASIGRFGRMAFDPSGNLYFIDGTVIRRISTSGVVSTLSTETDGFLEGSIAVDSSGYVWLTSTGGRFVRISPAGQRTDFAALQTNVYGLAVGASGTVFFAGYGSVFEVGASGTPVSLWTGQAYSIAARPSGGVTWASRTTIYERPQSGIVSAITGPYRGYGDDNGLAASASFEEITGLAYDSNGTLYVADSGTARVRSIGTDGVVRTVAGGAWVDNVPATSAHLLRPRQIARDQAGRVYVLDGFQVRRIAADGMIRNYAGNGRSGPHTEGALATTSALDGPMAIACDATGNLYIATTSALLRVTSDGIVRKFSDLQADQETRIAITTDGAVYASLATQIVKISAAGITAFAAFASASGLAIGPTGDLYAVSSVDDKLYRIRPTGAVEKITDVEIWANSLGVDAEGSLYAVHRLGYGSIHKFNPATHEGTALTFGEQPRFWPDYLRRPVGIVVEGVDRLLVTNASRHTVERYERARCRFSLRTYVAFYHPVSGLEPVTVDTDPGCIWESKYSVTTPGLQYSGESRGVGPGQATLDDCCKGVPTSIELTVAGYRVAVHIMGTVSSAGTNVAAPASGMTGSHLNISPWQARSNRSWVQVFPLSGAASGTVTYTVFPNFSTTPRAAQILSGTQLINITQAGSTLTADQRFVQRLYFNFFGRVPSAAELALQVQSLQRLGRAALFDSFFRVPEFDNGGRFIAGLYVGILNRDAEFGGWLFQRNALVTGVVTQSSLVPGFLDSPEFQQRNGTLSDDAFVRLLYRQVLLRTPTEPEVAFQARALRDTTRGKMAENFLLSQEFRTGTGPRLTTFLLHALLLGRDPSDGERADFLSKLQAGSSVPVLAQELLETQEFSLL